MGKSGSNLVCFCVELLTGMDVDMRYVFGPVPSRRLGQSLGIDTIPLKTCNWNCVYCQLGRTTPLTNQREIYYPPEEIIAEVKSVLGDPNTGQIDWITFVGSGEPTLHAGIGNLIQEVKALSNLPVAVITNGATLYLDAVRQALSAADAVMPSLDAGTPWLYKKINRPHTEIDFERFVEGLCRFRAEFNGQIWLEVFLVEGINTNAEQIQKIKAAADKIGPDKIQLNTAVRPTAEAQVVSVDADKLALTAKEFGPNAEAVADYAGTKGSYKSDSQMETIMEMLKRRPCRLSDISAGTGIRESNVAKYLQNLQKQDKITSQIIDSQTFFQTK